jgi:hypothetical protein
MSDPSLPPDSSGSDQRLTARVVARVEVAHRNVRGRPGQGRRRRLTDTDTRALRRVFRDLGESYRDYRRRTGEPVSADVRDAALRFRREQNLVSLVSVAASLDRLDHDLVG